MQFRQLSGQGNTKRPMKDCVLKSSEVKLQCNEKKIAFIIIGWVNWIYKL